MSCSSTKIYIDVLGTPETQFSKPIENVALVSRVSLQSSNTKQYINGRVIAQFNGITEMMVNEAINQVEIELNANNFLTAFDTSFKYIPKNGSFKQSSPLPSKVTKRLCRDLQVDAIVSVEGYDAEIDTDHEVQYSTPVDRNYGTVRVPYFIGDQSVYMQMLFRTYICDNGTGKAENETAVATQVTSSVSGNTAYDVNAKMADANNVLIQAARNLGTDYANQIAPNWETQSRLIYKSGNSQLVDAYKLAKEGNWPAATDIWYLVASLNEDKLAKKASFNLILASEISGDYELAEEWARRCINKYKMDEAEKYLATIKERKAEIEKLHSLFPLMLGN